MPGGLELAARGEAQRVCGRRTSSLHKDQAIFPLCGQDRARGVGAFLAFAGAFALMAAAQVFTLMGRSGQEGNGQVYLPRLAAFVLIIVAILGKNLPSRRT